MEARAVPFDAFVGQGLRWGAGLGVLCGALYALMVFPSAWWFGGLSGLVLGLGLGAVAGGIAAGRVRAIEDPVEAMRSARVWASVFVGNGTAFFLATLEGFPLSLVQPLVWVPALIAVAATQIAARRIARWYFAQIQLDQP